MRRPVLTRLVLLLIGAASVAAPLAAQRPAPLAPRAEVRLVLPVTPSPGALAGVGAEIRAGWYARVGIGVAAGVAHRAERWHATQQAALTARFLFDPYGERPFGLYGGAGLAVSGSEGRSSRGEFLLLAGVEGAARGRFAPAVEVILGGGLRVQGVVRARRAVGR